MAAMLNSPLFWLWGVPIALYALFWLWYTPLSGPMTRAEVAAVVADLEARGASADRIATLRAFFEADDGRSFVMVNLIDLAKDPPALPATGPNASAQDLMDHYMQFMWPELLRRGCHPVFVGRSAGASLDLAGIEGAERWGQAALMRYRSRRDMWAISSDPRFRDRHEYKLAALEKTIALPVTPQFFPGDLRLLLLLALLAALGLVNGVALPSL
ncbi:MAG: hypothetical protein V2J14_02755 [Erythrobacter sp.]|jgi:hypothetical protein|nr:hypothetical protein [Erythrobacter sp.]